MRDRPFYANPSDVTDETAEVAPSLFGGVRYDWFNSDDLPAHCGSRRLVAGHLTFDQAVGVRFSAGAFLFQG